MPERDHYLAIRPRNHVVPLMPILPGGKFNSVKSTHLIWIGVMPTSTQIWLKIASLQTPSILGTVIDPCPAMLEELFQLGKNLLEPISGCWHQMQRSYLKYKSCPSRKPRSLLRA